MFIPMLRMGKVKECGREPFLNYVRVFLKMLLTWRVLFLKVLLDFISCGKGALILMRCIFIREIREWFLILYFGFNSLSLCRTNDTCNIIHYSKVSEEFKKMIKSFFFFISFKINASFSFEISTETILNYVSIYLPIYLSVCVCLFSCPQNDSLFKRLWLNDFKKKLKNFDLKFNADTILFICLFIYIVIDRLI